MKDKPKNDTTTKTNEWPVGLFIHTFKNGKLHKQGRVVAVEGNYVAVQLYSWIDGSETHIEGMARADLYQGGTRLYLTAEHWNDAAAVQQKRELRNSGAVH